MTTGIGTTHAERVAFSTSRMMEYVSEKELSTQIGASPSRWPLVLVKELVDNALDACEAAGLAPRVRVTRGDDYFEVEDAGPGLPPGVVKAALDFSTRTSSNSKYVSPTRGQLGNALKCVVAAPAVLFPGGRAGVTVTACGVEHRILITPDAIAQAPRIDHQQRPVEKPGTCVRVDWPGIACWGGRMGGPEFYNGELPDLLRSFAFFNPHAEISLDGEALLAPAPLKKWQGCDRTSAHWYTAQQLTDLIAAHVHRERLGEGRPRSVRDLVTNFHRLTGSSRAPAVLRQAGLSGKMLADLAGPDGIDMGAVRRLLHAMMEAAPPPRPQALGLVGPDRVSAALAGLDGAGADAVRYRRECGVDEAGRPYVVEVAFALHADYGRRLTFRFGVNWSPSLNPPHEAYELLDDAEIDNGDPAVLAVHVVTPRAAYADTGKSQARLSQAAARAVALAVGKATAAYTREKRKTERKQRIREDQVERLSRPPREMTLRDAAFQVMAEAHAHVIGDRPGAPAQARQIMYAARKLIQRLIGSRCWKSSDTFTQGLLPDYVAEHPDETAGWNVVYDERGEMIEPHGGSVVAMGTLQVREYLAGLAGSRPQERFGHVLLVEKEGFRNLIEHARIADRFDVALAWTKGMSTTAARELVDGLSGIGVTTLVLHDFDTYGLSIAHTLCNSARRYTFRNRPLVCDIGLRLADVEALRLEGEEFEYRSRKKDPRELLASRGVSQAEQEFLVRGKAGHRSYVGRRVELNELTNDQFITFIEAKLVEAGVKKVVPPSWRLQEMFASCWRVALVDRAVEEATRKAREEVEKLQPPVPDDIETMVRKEIDGTAGNWWAALARMARKAIVLPPST